MSTNRPIAGIFKWLALGFVCGVILLFAWRAFSSDQQITNDAILDQQAREGRQ